MSTFGTTDNVSGPVESAQPQLITSTPSEKDTFTGKSIKRPTFEWNDRSTQAFKEILPTGVYMHGWDSYYNGWGFARSVMSNRGGVGNWLKPAFMERCDERRGKVKHIFSNMKRLRAREYIKTNEIGVFEEGKIREYLTFVIRHIGKDWKGLQNSVTLYSRRFVSATNTENRNTLI
jgi:hypothetical protein